MKQLFKQVMATLGLLSLILVVIFSTIATIAGDSGSLRTLLMGGELRLKSGARLTGYGTSYVSLGDSAYLRFGGRTADTTNFSGTLKTIAVPIPGATYGDVFYISKREVAGVSTSASTDSCSISYMVVPDTLIIKRTNGLTSGLKVSWIRAKLN